MELSEGRIVCGSHKSRVGSFFLMFLLTLLLFNTQAFCTEGLTGLFSGDAENSTSDFIQKDSFNQDDLISNPDAIISGYTFNATSGNFSQSKWWPGFSVGTTASLKRIGDGQVFAVTATGNLTVYAVTCLVYKFSYGSFSGSRYIALDNQGNTHFFGALGYTGVSKDSDIPSIIVPANPTVGETHLVPWCNNTYTVISTNDTFYSFTGCLKISEMSSAGVILSYTWYNTTYGVVGIQLSQDIYVRQISGGSTPSVSSVSPSNNASNVSVNTSVSATFSTTMNDLNTSTFTLSSSSSQVSGTVSMSSDKKTATFTPSSALSGNTQYTATITTGASDTNGNFLTSNYSWIFSTGGGSGGSGGSGGGGGGGCFINSAQP
ncbi:MAG: Ig-like domain-containing protein [Deltaproteobacteria bacterium]|nr:Ig-like domain-containing protein [Deltaproteobacteria bacterium]